jgi:hypothetical protein
MPDARRCEWPEQAFFGGEALRQVASNPATGSCRGLGAARGAQGRPQGALRGGKRA